MGKRIKKVFSNADQVIHLWANQSQTDARCRNAYFDGRSVFSYGSHYELGRLTEFKGIQVALINDTGYSVTTAGHISSAWHAVSHLTRIKMSGISESASGIEAALVETQGELIETLFDVFNGRVARRSEYLLESDYGPSRDVKEFNETCIKLGFKHLVLEISEEYREMVREHAKQCEARQAELNSPEALAKKEANALKRAAREREKLSASIAAWRNGGQLIQGIRNLEPQLIRVNGDKVQTSGGAEVPLSHALRLLKMVEKGTAKAGEPVGSFRLNAVRNNVVQIGCHTIEIAEAKAVLATAKAA